jgi:nicotinate phosphoribosyltransferase
MKPNPISPGVMAIAFSLRPARPHRITTLSGVTPALRPAAQRDTLCPPRYAGATSRSPYMPHTHAHALLTDLYELTMACGYHALGIAERDAAFHLSFRKNPFDGGFALACGLHDVIDYLQHLHFAEDDLAYLATLTGTRDAPLFTPGFLDYLRDLRFACTVHAMPEGTAVFPHEPLIRVEGPVLQCQLVETALLNLINFPTLVATKAARICRAARGQPVLEFGLRRAQGVNGALTACRAAYVGGCAATSNVLAGKTYGIPVKGTHAHSWVMCFASELEAFRAYAAVMPHNCVLLVDTYDTLAGVRHAIAVARELQDQGDALAGIRLDSGDLAYLSIEARKLLDEAGFANVAIVASNDLDEEIIRSLKDQGATIAVWGVGTKLVTAYDQPALGGVYKLAALRNAGGAWQHKVKLSEQSAKTTIPGILQVRRFTTAHGLFGDMICDELTTPRVPAVFVDPLDLTRRRIVPADATHEDLLVPIFERGRLVYDPPSLESVRTRARQQLDALHPTITRTLNAHQYPVGLEQNLFTLRANLILQARGLPPDPP